MRLSYIFLIAYNINFTRNSCYTSCLPSSTEAVLFPTPFPSSSHPLPAILHAFPLLPVLLPFKPPSQPPPSFLLLFPVSSSSPVPQLHIGAFSFLQEIFKGKLILQKCFKIDIFGCYGTHLEGLDKKFEVLNSF